MFILFFLLKREYELIKYITLVKIAVFAGNSSNIFLCISFDKNLISEEYVNFACGLAGAIFWFTLLFLLIFPRVQLRGSYE